MVAGFFPGSSTRTVGSADATNAATTLAYRSVLGPRLVETDAGISRKSSGAIARSLIITVTTSGRIILHWFVVTPRV